MTAAEITIYSYPLKPVAGPDRTPALIAREVDQIMRRTKETVTLASIAIGYRLIEAKRLEGHGGWLPWLAARGINERTARRTIELASHHEYLSEARPEKLPDFVTKSLRQALAIVHEEKAVRTGGKPRPRGKSNGERPDEPEVEILPPDPIHVLHHLAQQWTADQIRRHQLTEEQADLLEEDLPALLPALIELAERHDVSTGIVQAEAAARQQVEQAIETPISRARQAGSNASIDMGRLIAGDPQAALAALWWHLNGAEPPEGELRIIAPPAPAPEGGPVTLYCSFCSKSQHAVANLIAGPDVWICDECIDLCADIVAKSRAAKAAAPAQDAPEPEAGEDALPEPVASPGAPQADQGTLRQRLADRLDQRYGDWRAKGTMAPAARAIGMTSSAGLKRFLEGGTVYGKTLALIEAYLSA